MVDRYAPRDAIVAKVFVAYVNVGYRFVASAIFKYVVEAVVVERNEEDEALGIYASDVDAASVR